jgi:hypothetical protein
LGRNGYRAAVPVLLLQGWHHCNNRRLAGLALGLIAEPVLPFPAGPALLRCAAVFHYLSLTYSPSRHLGFLAVL